MAHVVWIRGGNVGGRNVFRPARLAAELAHLDVVNVGAAGTFVVRARATAAAIEREVAARIPFATAVVVRAARDVLALRDAAPFRGVAFSRDLRGWVAALAGRPRAGIRLPVAVPDGRDWSVRVDRVERGFALGLWRRRPSGLGVAGPVVERALGVPATVRWWETFERLFAVLSERRPPP
jgi:uncharacterized protein (DUF1697 family)